MKKNTKIGSKIITLLLATVIGMTLPTQGVHAEEDKTNETTMEVVVNRDNNAYGVQPLTTLLDCEIIMAFSATEGLVMTFTTSCMDVASVIGVKDIKVQQKMWYGWKTVLTSDGAEDYNHAIFGADLVYPEAIKDKTYRVICTHYADYDGYEEVVNDTGAFQFTY